METSSTLHERNVSFSTGQVYRFTGALWSCYGHIERSPVGVMQLFRYAVILEISSADTYT